MRATVRVMEPRSINATTMPEVIVVEKRPPRFMRVKDCAEDLACCRSHITNLIKAGKLRSYKIGGLRLIAADDWDEYLATAVAVPVEEKSK